MNSRCLSCTNKDSKEYRRTKKGLITKIYGSQRASSKKRGHSLPDYTINEFRKWVLDKPEFHIIFNQWVEHGYDNILTPSADRLDDYKPYTLNNLQIVTWAENNKKYRDDVKKGVNNKKSKAVVQLTLNSDFIARHYSIGQASRSTGVHRAVISECCSGKYKTAGGFRWIFSLDIIIANNHFCGESGSR